MYSPDHLGVFLISRIYEAQPEETMSLPKPADRVLCLLPFPEPRDYLARFRNRFPGIEITFVSARTTQGESWGDEAPSEGNLISTREFVCLTYLIRYS